MTLSMTAFSRRQKQLDSSILCWEIKSVNHRYLDVSFRMPEAFRFLEPQLRALLRDRVSRGKIECQLKYQNISSENQSILINEGLVNGLVDAAQKLSSKLCLANDLQISQLLTWPGVIQFNEVDTERLGRDALELFNESVQQLSEVRKKEGQALEQLIRERLDKLSAEITQARTLASTMVEKSKEKLLERIAEIDLNVSETRIEQEIALMLARLDVHEELDRLQTHVQEVGRILSKEEVAGRRLDFLMQELNREANTLSSKSDLVELTRTAVEMKVLIEQMREQIQNIE